MLDYQRVPSGYFTFIDGLPLPMKNGGSFHGFRLQEKPIPQHSMAYYADTVPISEHRD